MQEENLYKSKKIWLDGKIIDFNKAKIHVLNHSLHYGSAVFEGIRFYGSNDKSYIFRLKDHLKRLFFSASKVGIKVPFKEKDIISDIKRLIKSNNLSDGYIRILVFYGNEMSLLPKNIIGHVVIATWKWGAYLGSKALKIKKSKFVRLHPRSVISEAKISGYYINSIFAFREAQKLGFNDAILLDYNNNIAEASVSNIFIVKNKRLLTPARESILPGITRDSIIKIASNLGIKVLEKKIKIPDLINADEAFLAGTAVEIVPIGKVDSHLINKGEAGPITQKLQEAYKEIVLGKNNKYKRWLTEV